MSDKQADIVIKKNLIENSTLNKFSTLLSDDNKTEPHLHGHQVLGEPCFCLKARERNSKKKFFINFCSSSEVKYPTLDWDEQKCIEMHQKGSREFEDYRIPLALKPLSWTRDKKGEDKHFVLDVLVNDRYMEERVLKSEFFKNFLIVVSIDTVESKYSRSNYDALDHALDIEKESFIILKNKRYQEQSGFVTKQTSSSANDNTKSRKIALLEDGPPDVSDSLPNSRKDRLSTDNNYKLTYCCGTNSLKGVVKCKSKQAPEPDLESLKLQISTDHIVLTVNNLKSPTGPLIKLLDVYITMLIDVSNSNHSVIYDTNTDCLKFNLKLCDNY